MKKVLLKVCTVIICSLLLYSCEKEPNEWDEQQGDSFYGYNIENRNDFDLRSITQCPYNQDTAFLTGIKNEKYWIGMFDSHTKEQLQEWNGTETIERKIKINKGYGEIETMRLSAYHFDRDIYKTNWGFAMIPYYTERDSNWSIGISEAGGRTRDILLLNGDKVITYSLNNPSIANPCWFQESIITSSYEYGGEGSDYAVISPKGKKLAELKEVPDKEWYIDFIPVSYTEDIGLIQAPIYPNNEEMGQYTRIRKRDHSVAKTIWSTDIPSLKNLEDNARVNASILEQNNPIWKYQIDITNYDGSKQQVKFSVDIVTGEIKYI